MGLLAGCAIKPVPHYGKVDTYEIVRTVRCEARDALRELLAAGLPTNGDTRPAVSEKYFSDAYSSLGMAFDFSFLANVANDNSGSVSASGVWPVGTFTIKAGGKYNRYRKNTRSFLVSDNARDLIDDKRGYCKTRGPGENRVYPIAGRIGLAESIRTFVELNERGDLRSKTDKVPTMVDQIEFSTTIGADTTPSFKGSAGIGHLHIVDANYTGSVTRTDVHTLKFALSMPTPPAAAPAKAGTKKGKRPRGDAGRSAEENAVKAIREIEANNFIRLLDDLKQSQAVE